MRDAPPPPPAKRRQAEALLLAGCRRSRVPAELCADGWTADDDEVERTIAAAEAVILADARVSSPGCDLPTALAVCQAQDLYAHSMRLADHATALSAVRELNRLRARPTPHILPPAVSPSPQALGMGAALGVLAAMVRRPQALTIGEEAVP